MFCAVVNGRAHFRIVRPIKYVFLSGYIGSSCFLLQVKDVIQDLKKINPDLIYGLYSYTVYSSLSFCFIKSCLFINVYTTAIFVICDWLLGWLVFNGTFCTKRLYHAM